MDVKTVYLSKPWLKNYSPEVNENPEISIISVSELFNDAVNKYKNNIALIFYGKKIKYKKLKELIDRFATALS